MRLFTVRQGNRKGVTVNFRYPDTKGYFAYLEHRANLIFRNEKPSSFNRTEVQIDDTVKYLFRVPFECEIISSVSRSSARDLSHASMAGLITP